MFYLFKKGAYMSKRNKEIRKSYFLWKALSCLVIIGLCLTPAIQSKINLLFGINSVWPVAIVFLLIAITANKWQESIEGFLQFSQWLIGLCFILAYSAVNGLLELNLINRPLNYGAGVIGEWWLRVTNPLSGIFNEAGQLIILNGSLIDKAILGNFVAVSVLVGFLFIAITAIIWWKK